MLRDVINMRNDYMHVTFRIPISRTASTMIKKKINFHINNSWVFLSNKSIQLNINASL